MEIILILLVVYIAIFYFLKMRPEKQRRKEQEAMKKALVPGDSVTMIDGMIGNICAVKEKTVVIETGADRVRLEYATWAIMNKGVSVDQTQQ
ncbi:MAG: preprotein translocase subunit YajC [Evtepia sp.]|uniref:preprotein translocase subunit YajC n=1 Tax=Evtepia sp. TaxID=2773933 RepID=UPI002A75BFF4|nr:preprotein translocase subunit YajC [Evtepia sp.]MDY3013624.1 preprotein translocase subunit YajC [Evtepia sp.]